MWFPIVSVCPITRISANTGGVIMDSILADFFSTRNVSVAMSLT